ncbi:MAG: DUF1697 domain-containing protein [Gaiellaceae bacterium]
MPTYIAMLRGINIGPSKRVEMARLRKVLERAGFKRVRTYIQSGNVVFNARKNTAAGLAEKIEKAMVAEFGFGALVMIRTEQEMSHALGNNPFVKESGKDPAKVHVCFLSETPAAEAVKALHALGTKVERVKCAGNEVYVYHLDGLGKAKVLNHGVLERILAVKVTMRNWNTSSKLREMAESRASAEDAGNQNLKTQRARRIRGGRRES